MLPAEKQIFMQRVRSLKRIVERVQNGPAAATNAVLSLWQARSYPALQKTNSKKIDGLTNVQQIGDLAIWLAERPFLESAFWLSSAYSIWVGDDVRSKKSLYFTPPILAERLIDNLVSQGASFTKHVWMDPACGGGAFLAPVAVRMIQALKQQGATPSTIIKHLSKSLVGNDIDSVLADLAEQFLRMALYGQILECKHEPVFKISIGDGLIPEISEENKFDVLICNPPYRKMKADEVNGYKPKYADVIEGQPNMYGLFIRQCLAIGKKGAIVGLLTPTSYLSGQNFSKLRTRILVESDVCQIDLVDDRMGIFIGVSQGAVLTVYKLLKITGAIRPPTEVYALSRTGEFTHVGTCQFPKSGLAWPVPRNTGDEGIIAGAGKSLYRLKDFGYTARIGTYVDYRDTRKTYANQPNNKTMKAVFPIIWSSDVTSAGQLIHGRTSKEDKHHTFIEMGDPSHAAIVRRPCIALQRVTSPDQPRRLVCAPVNDDFIHRHGGVVGENHVIFLEQSSDGCALSPAELAAVLGSKQVDRLFRSISGAVNVSVFELNQLPLPNPMLLAEYLQLGRSLDDAVNRAFLQGITH